MMNTSMTTALMPSFQKGYFYHFAEPQQWLRGRAEDWGLIEDALQTYRRPHVDNMNPFGALAGYFTYDGDFEFAVFSSMSLVRVDGLLPDEAASGSGVDVASVCQWKENTCLAEFSDMIQKAQEAICAGEIYQVNLTRRYAMQVAELDSLELFKHLWHITEAPRSAYFKGQNLELMSASPETFLEMHDHSILTQPIKGTRPRSRDEMTDKQNAFDLMTDPKEVAELIMITDLLRNDLGQVCEFGSVTVSELVSRQAYSHVFHLYSKVEGRLRENVSHVQALRDCFPGGSISGAPKSRACAIIEELEKANRGAYTGAIGYFGFDGSSLFNIAIRTLEYSRLSKELSFGVGSGITAASSSEEEFKETEHKASAMLDAVASYMRSTQSVHEQFIS
ncbi:MAG: anthranilate synthase component I family protein [Verrucomicrobiota bacterium]